MSENEEQNFDAELDQDINELADDIVNEDLPLEEQPAEIEEPAVTKGAQKRIDELTRQKHDERRRADKLANELDDLRAAQNKQPAQAAPTGAPDPDKYPAGRYDPDYLEARQDWQIEQRFQRESAARQSQAKESTITQLESTIKETKTDYDSVKADFFTHDLASVPAFMDLVKDSDNPAELVYFLGKNPEEIDKIGTMTPAQATRYIGRLEARIESNTPTPATKKVSAAPKPITPVGSAKGSNANKQPENMTMEEFVAWSKNNTKR
jgi:hypothetical protein